MPSCYSGQTEPCSGTKARFTLTDNPAGPAVSINGTVGAYLFAIIAAAAGVAMLVLSREKWFGWLIGTGIVSVTR